MSLNGQPEDAAAEDRRMKFKNVGKTKDEMRRRRVEDNVELRKAKKEETLMKRRNVDFDNLVSSPESPAHDEDESVVTSVEEEVKEAALGLTSSDANTKFLSVQRLRKILSREQNPPIDLVINAGLLSAFVDGLHSPDEKMQFEAAWALTNVASGTSAHTQAVIDVGAVPVLLQLMVSSTNADVSEQAMWGLGNIAGDGPKNRDALIGMGMIPIMLEVLQRPGLSRSFLKNLSWMISNLVRGKNPPPDFKNIKVLIPALNYLLDSKDLDTTIDALWSLSYISDGPEEQIDAVIEAGVIPKVIALMRTTDPRILSPCVRVVGNIVTGNDVQTDHAVQNGLMDVLVPLLSMPKTSLVKEVCWVYSNIAAGSSEQIQTIFETAALPPILSVLRTGEFRCQKEAAWVVTNIMAGGTSAQVQALLELDALTPLCDLMKSNDPKFVVILLDALANLLASARKFGFLDEVTRMIEECGGLDILETMQNHDNEEVYDRSFKIIEEYFQEEDDVAVATASDEGVEAGGPQFQF